MATTATRKGTLVRGYRIKIILRSKPSIVSNTIWSSDVPTEWTNIASDPTVNEAELFRSGRKVATFVRSATSSQEVA